MPDTRTYGNMVTKIASELSRDDLASTDAGIASIREAIRSAVYFYQPHAMFVNEAIATSPTVAGTSTYDLPTDLVSLTQLDFIQNNVVYPLTRRWYQRLDAMDSIVSGAIQGFPEEYDIYNHQVRLFPTPSDVYTLRFIYYAGLPFPETDGASSFWTTTGEALIRARAKYTLNMDVIRDAEAASMDKQSEKEAFEALMHQTAEKLHTGRIESWEGP